MITNASQRRIKSGEILEYAIVVLFIALLLAKDLLNTPVPSILFSILWVIGLFVWDYSFSAAFTISAAVCFSSSLSIVIPAFAFIVLTMFKKKAIKRSPILISTLVLIALEAMNYVMYSNQNFRQFVSTIVQLILVSTVIQFQAMDDKHDAGRIIKTYLFFFMILSLDIIILTVKRYGATSGILSSGFRIGQTNFSGSITAATSTLSMNANGVALLAIIAVAVSFILARYKLIKKPIAIASIVYCSIIGFMTVSKTFFFVFSGMMGLLFFEYLHFNKKKAYKYIPAVVGVVILIFAFSQTTFFANIVARFRNSELTTGRSEILIDYLKYMSNNIKAQIIGIGSQNLPQKTSIIYVPHNAIVEIFVSFGLIGIISYIVFFLCIFRENRLWYRRIHAKPDYICFIPIITYSIFLQAVQFTSVSYIYYLLVITVMCMYMNPELIVRE